MNAKERAIDALEFFKAGNNVSAESVLNLFMEAVKEECCSGELKWEPIPGWIDPLKPQLIQGYTAEQWQEIIDGGYLCEFSGGINGYALGKLYLPPRENVFILAPQYAGGEKEFHHCNPAQIKGVMRPIFVEPVDREAWCVFFGKDKMPISPNLRGETGYGQHSRYEKWASKAKDNGATSYIEV